MHLAIMEGMEMSDVFSLFDDFGDDRAGRKPKSTRNKRGGFVSRNGLVVRTTPKAVLFFDDIVGYEYWVPRTSVRDWSFMTGVKRGLGLSDLEPDDEISLELPRWLLVKEKIL